MMSNDKRLNSCYEFLKREGYCPEIDNDEDIIFKIEGHHCILILSDPDPMFYTILFLPFIDCPEDEESKRLFKDAAFETTEDMKHIKIGINKNGEIYATSETFFDTPEAFQSMFYMYSRVLSMSPLVFLKTLEKKGFPIQAFLEKQMESSEENEDNGDEGNTKKIFTVEE